MVDKAKAAKGKKPAMKKTSVKDLDAGKKSGKVKGGTVKPDVAPSVKCTD